MSAEFSRQAYQDRIKAQLHELDAQIDRLKAKEEQMEANARQQYYEYMQDLQMKREDIGARVNALVEVSADILHDMRKGIDTAVNTLSMEVSAAAKRFNVIRPEHDETQQHQ
ncbi:MAG: hypothetical protein GYB65_13770 [Chloroflexi bacterium]|nr:hypothetical protein [Chloroflexota bacterium]